MLNWMKNRFPEGLWVGREERGGRREGGKSTLLTFATPIETSPHWPVTTPLMSSTYPAGGPEEGRRSVSVHPPHPPSPLLLLCFVLLLLFDRRKFYRGGGAPLHQAPCSFVNLRSGKKTFRGQVIAPLLKVTFFYTPEERG